MQGSWDFNSVPLVELDKPFNTVLWTIVIETILMIDIGPYNVDLERVSKRRQIDNPSIRLWAAQHRAKADRLRGVTAETPHPLNLCLPTKQGTRRGAGLPRPTHCSWCKNPIPETDIYCWDNYGFGTPARICGACHQYQHTHGIRRPQWMIDNVKSYGRGRGIGLKIPPLVNINRAW